MDGKVKGRRGIRGVLPPSSVYLAALLVPWLLSCFSAAAFSIFPGKGNSGFVAPKHAKGVNVVDFARHDLPKVRMGERTIDLMSGIHFVSLFSTPGTVTSSNLLEEARWGRLDLSSGRGAL